MESPKKGTNYKEMRRIALKAIGGSDSDPKADKESKHRSITRRVAKSGPLMPQLDSIRIRMPKKKVKPENKARALKKTRKRVAKSRSRRKAAKRSSKSANKFTVIGLVVILMVLVIFWFSFLIYKCII